MSKEATKQKAAPKPLPPNKAFLKVYTGLPTRDRRPGDIFGTFYMGDNPHSWPNRSLGAKPLDIEIDRADKLEVGEGFPVGNHLTLIRVGV